MDRFQLKTEDAACVGVLSPYMKKFDIETIFPNSIQLLPLLISYGLKR